jgi:WD40 repeat protein
MTIDAPARVDNPYVGPTSFRLGDPLYGRDAEQQDLLDLLVAERIVLLYSPSGAGKTSLIQAALVPALTEAGFEVLPVIRVTHALAPRPGMPTPRNRYVLGTLLSLEERVPPDSQRPIEELCRLTLPEYMAAYADRDGRPGNEVLLFDQFEEVLTADPTDETAKHEFFRELGELLRDRGHWALFSMREDFLAALDPYLRHVPTRFRSTFRLDLLSVPAALDAMRLPAERAGVEFTEEAADRLVDDLRRVRVQQPGGRTEEALGSYVEPVQLQVACRLLWSSLPAGSTRITRADVEALGNVDQALGDYYADRLRTISEQTGTREAAIREWFEECLITPQGLRGQVLEGPDVAGEASRTVLLRLVGAHLVRAERRRQATWYELAHDRLIEPVRRNNALWRAEHLTAFERAALLWAEQGRPDRLLLLGPDLAAAEKDPAVREGTVKARECDFLTASQRADEQQRHDRQMASSLRRSARRLKVAVALVTALALAAGVFLYQSWSTGRRAERQEEASRLLLSAQRNLDSDPGLAGALAATGAGLYGVGGLSDNARDVLYMAAASPVSLVYRGQRGPTRSAAWSGDGRVLVTAGADDLQLWDAATGKPGEKLALRTGDVVNGLDVNGDGRAVVAGLDDGTILVWHVGSPDPLRWSDGTGRVGTLDLSPDGRQLATVGAGPEVTLWDIDGTWERTVTDPVSTTSLSVAYSPDGRTIATTSDASEVLLWDTASGAETGRLALPEAAWSVAFGQDATTLATMTQNTVTVWDLTTGTAPNPPVNTYSDSVNVSADLSRAVAVSSYGAVSVYDTSTGTTLADTYGPGAPLCCAGFSGDSNEVLVLAQDADPTLWRLPPTYGYAGATAVTGDRVVSSWGDGTLHVWRNGTSPGAGITIPVVDARDVVGLAADSDSGRLAGVTSTGEVQVWDGNSGAPLGRLGPDAGSFTTVALTPDGTELVTGDAAGRVARWDAATGEERGQLLPAGDRPAAKVELSKDGGTVLATFGAPVSGSEPPTAGRGGQEPAAVLTALSGGGEPVDLQLPAGRPPAVAVNGTSVPETAPAAAFGSDGTHVFLGTSRGRVAGFDVRTGHLVWSAVAHQEAVRDVVVDDSTGDVLTTGGALPDQTTSGSGHQVVLFDASGRRIRQVPSTTELMTAVLTTDGDHVTLFDASSGAHAPVPLHDDELLRVVRSKVAHEVTPEECEYYRMASGC